MVFDQSLLDDAEEIVIEAGIHDKNDDFGCPIPISIDGNETRPSQRKIIYSLYGALKLTEVSVEDLNEPESR